MKIFSLTLAFLCVLPSCSNPGKKIEADRRNIHLARFFYEQDIPSKSIAHASKIKPGSRHYAEAQELILQIEGSMPESDE